MRACEPPFVILGGPFSRKGSKEVGGLGGGGGTYCPTEKAWTPVAAESRMFVS